MAKRKKNQADQGRVVPIERFIPDDTPMHFSDNVVIQHTQNEFIITFLQVQHPLAITKEEMAEIRKVRSKAVARIALTPAGMQSLLEVFGRNFDRFVEKYGTNESEAHLEDQTIESDMSSNVQQVEHTASFTEEDSDEE